MTGAAARPSVFLFLLAVALVGGASAGALILAGEERGGGLAAVVAGAALAGSSSSARDAPRLVLLQAVSERLVEAAILTAIAWVALPAAPWQATAAITALVASYLMTYLRLRSVALGFRLRERALLRAVPLQLVAIGLLVGLVQIGLVAAALVALLVLAEEVLAVTRQREAG